MGVRQGAPTRARRPPVSSTLSLRQAPVPLWVVAGWWGVGDGGRPGLRLVWLAGCVWVGTVGGCWRWVDCLCGCVGTDALCGWVRVARAVHDSLQLSAACGQPAVDRHPPALAQRRASAAAASRTVYVSPGGDDTNTGADAAHPLRSLNRAVATIRLARACDTCGGPAQIFLAKGTYFIGSTLHLEPNDSGLTISAMPGVAPEECVLSGGMDLSGLKWEESAQGKGIHEAKLPGGGAGFSTLFVGKPGEAGTLRRAVRARHPNANPEVEGLWTPHGRTGYNAAASMRGSAAGVWRQHCTPITGNTPNLSLPDFWYGNYSMVPASRGASGFTDRPFTNAFVEFWCGKWAAFKGVQLLQDA